MEKILVTGSSGFIGMHLCQSLLQDGFVVYGIDNMNDYYDVSLKISRLKQLSQFDNFKFEKVDISNLTQINKVFKDFRPDKVVNLAAQAGVRHSIKNPHSYILSNIVGFTNIIECCRHHKIKGLIYASSSSVYGKNEEHPFRERDPVERPLSIYAASKISNELIAFSYHNLYGLKTTGLRFFSVYGPWGRPDMAVYIFTKKISEGEEITVFNNGEIIRSFTYIDDIVFGIRLAIEKNHPNEKINLGNYQSENLMDMISHIESALGKKAKIKFSRIQPADIPQTYSDINYAIEKLNYDPITPLSIGVEKFIDWFLKYNNKI